MRAIAARAASETNANDALELLKTLRLRGTRTRDVFDALVALERFFASARRGRTRRASADESVDEASWTTEEAARVKYLRWLAKHHDVGRRVTDVVVDGACEPRVRVLALAVIMEVAVRDAGEVFQRIIRKDDEEVRVAVVGSELLGSWAKRYASRVDVRYYTYMVMKSIAGELRDNSYEPSEESGGEGCGEKRVRYIKRLADVRGSSSEGVEETKRRSSGKVCQNAREMRGAEGAAGDEDEEEKRLDRGAKTPIRARWIWRRRKSDEGRARARARKRQGDQNGPRAFDTVARSATRGSRSYARNSPRTFTGKFSTFTASASCRTWSTRSCSATFASIPSTSAD